VKPPRVGVLLVNLGSPPATDPASVRRYLRERDRHPHPPSPLFPTRGRVRGGFASGTGRAEVTIALGLCIQMLG